jgi:predicted PurR-regulated permease PerM
VAAAFFRAVPLVSTVLVGAAASLHCYLATEDALTVALVLCASYAYVDQRLATDIFEKQLKTMSSALLGMSVFLGLYAFGLQGVVYGPLLISIGQIVKELLSSLSYDEQNNLVWG